MQSAGLYADRLSINVELPSKKSLATLAPEKNPKTIKTSMTALRHYIDESKEAVKQKSKKMAMNRPKNKNQRRKSKVPIFSPAGQSTQMIVGADTSNDRKILLLANNLYDKFRMRRVYYSAFSPIPDSKKNAAFNFTAFDT